MDKRQQIVILKYIKILEMLKDGPKTSGEICKAFGFYRRNLTSLVWKLEEMGCLRHERIDQSPGRWYKYYWVEDLPEDMAALAAAELDARPVKKVPPVEVTKYCISNMIKVGMQYA